MRPDPTNPTAAIKLFGHIDQDRIEDFAQLLDEVMNDELTPNMELLVVALRGHMYFLGDSYHDAYLEFIAYAQENICKNELPPNPFRS